MKEIDICGKKYGKLTAIKKVGSDRWLFRCDCGKEKEIKKSRVLEGRSKSCGCVKRKHGMYKHPLTAILGAMIQRCTNESHPKYKNYGARGISVCKEWSENYKAFFDWAFSSGYKKGLTIERIDVNGNYCPENCRWIPNREQYWNKQNTVFIMWKGKKEPISKIQYLEHIKRHKLLQYRIKNERGE